MLTITTAKEIKGKISIAPSQDLFFLGTAMALAFGRATHISPVAASPRVSRWIGAFQSRASITADASSYTIEPSSEDNAASIFLFYDDLPYRDLTVFLLLGRFGSIVFDSLPPRRLLRWQALARRCGCSLRLEPAGAGSRLILDEKEHFRPPADVLDADDVHPFFGMAMGLRRPFTGTLDQPFSSPLRHALPCFGFECDVKALSPKKDEDPLMRRMRFLTTGKKSEGPTQFTVSADFSKDPVAQPKLTLPGDEVLAALFVLAKCLVPRGSLMVENVGLETWNTQMLQLLKTMGGTIGTQETHRGSFGSVGNVVVEKIDLFGRKVDCRPLYQFTSQLSSMVVMSAFAQGQSIFRSLDDLRDDEPDGIERLNSCIQTLGARFGEMPDGIVVEGAKQFDGFDVTASLPAPIAGATPPRAIRARWQ